MGEHDELTDAETTTRVALRDNLVSRHSDRVWDANTSDALFFRDASVALLPSFDVAKISGLMKFRSGLDKHALPRSIAASVPTSDEQVRRDPTPFGTTARNAPRGGPRVIFSHAMVPGVRSSAGRPPAMLQTVVQPPAVGPPTQMTICLIFSAMEKRRRCTSITRKAPSTKRWPDSRKGHCRGRRTY